MRSPVVLLFLGAASGHLGLPFLHELGLGWGSLCVSGIVGCRLLLVEHAVRPALLGAWFWGWTSAAASCCAGTTPPHQQHQPEVQTCEVLVGLVPLPPRGRSNRILVRDETGDQWVLENSGAIRPGERVWAVCHRRPPSLPLHPWDFDEAGHWFGRGWQGALVLDWLLIHGVERSLEGGLLRQLDQLRDRARYRLMPRRPEEGGTANAGGALLLGLTTGDRSGMTREVKAAFAGVGLAHLTAVSGFHVGLVLALLSIVLRSVGFGRRWAPLLSLPAVWGYVMVCGASPSALRAAAMATVASVVLSLGRRTNGVAVLSLVGLFLLAVRPCLVHDLGARLSFLATFGIVLWHETRCAPVRRWMAMVSVPVVATLFTLPVALPAFGRFPKLFFPANVVATPCVPLLSLLALAVVVLPKSAADWVSPKVVALATAAVRMVVSAHEVVPPWTTVIHPSFLRLAGMGLVLSAMAIMIRPKGWIHGVWGALFFVMVLRLGFFHSGSLQRHRLPSGEWVVHASGRAAVHTEFRSSGVWTWKTRTLLERVSNGPPLPVQSDSAGRISWSDLALIARSPRKDEVWISSPPSRCGSLDPRSSPKPPCP